MYEQISGPSSDYIFEESVSKIIQVKASYQKPPSPACSVPLSHLTSCVFCRRLFRTPEDYLLQALHI
jgi:hypothetical protein